VCEERERGKRRQEKGGRKEEERGERREERGERREERGERREERGERRARDAHLCDKVSNLGSEIHFVSDAVKLLGDVLVVSLDGLDIVVVHGDARGHGLGSVVAPMHEASLNLLVLWGRVELEVVDLPSDRVAPAADAPLDEDVIRHVEKHKLVSLDALLGQGLGLHSSAGEAVKKPTVFFAVVGVEAIPHDADDDVIGNERSLVHVLLRHLPHVSSL
jgi:hypothetical protein